MLKKASGFMSKMESKYLEAGRNPDLWTLTELPEIGMRMYTAPIETDVLIVSRDSSPSDENPVYRFSVGDKDGKLRRMDRIAEKMYMLIEENSKSSSQ